MMERDTVFKCAENIEVWLTQTPEAQNKSIKVSAFAAAAAATGDCVLRSGFSRRITMR